MTGVRVYAPASIGNVGVGFDVLGAAVERVDGQPLGDFVSAWLADAPRLEVTGPYASAVPQDPGSNLVGLAAVRYARAARRAGHSPRPVALRLDKQLPVGSGLGSSACSSVAAVAAVDAVQPFSLGEAGLLRLMAELEGVVSGSVHFDNVAPAFLGGMQLLVDQPERVCVRVPTPASWCWVLTHPGIRIATADAREALPEHYPRAATITHGRNLAAFVHACHVGDDALAAAMLVDVVAEPYRKALLPHFDRVRSDAIELGALAVGISGSGPTVFSVAPDEATAQRIAAHQAETWNLTGDGFQHVCRIAEAGIQAEALEDEG